MPTLTMWHHLLKNVICTYFTATIGYGKQNILHLKLYLYFASQLTNKVAVVDLVCCSAE